MTQPSSPETTFGPEDIIIKTQAGDRLNPEAVIKLAQVTDLIITGVASPGNFTPTAITNAENTLTQFAERLFADIDTAKHAEWAALRADPASLTEADAIHRVQAIVDLIQKAGFVVTVAPSSSGHDVAVVVKA